MLRSPVSFERLPLHGIVLLVGRPGVGKTTLAHGLADRVARLVQSLGPFAYVELDPHRLTSSALGRSQREVEAMFSETLGELAASGPMVVLIDEVETLATDRAQLSFETNPADVHRAVGTALVGLDRLAHAHTRITVIATSNFPEAIDGSAGVAGRSRDEMPLPGAAARRAILEDTIEALADKYQRRQAPARGGVSRRGRTSLGQDSTAGACARPSPLPVRCRDDTTVDPGRLRKDDLLQALRAPEVSVDDGGTASRQHPDAYRDRDVGHHRGSAGARAG